MSATTTASEDRPGPHRTGLNWARPTALAYEDDRRYLDFASRHAAARSRVGLALRRAIAEYGRACGATRAEGVRIGVHLFAGRAAAACVAVHLRQALPDDAELHHRVDAVTAALWPDSVPVVPALPSMRAGTALRRYARASSYGAGLHPALELLATAAMSTELPLGNRYTAALHHLTATTHRFHTDSPERHDTAALALAAVLGVKGTGARISTASGVPLAGVLRARGLGTARSTTRTAITA